jgi:hypothetical protein
MKKAHLYYDISFTILIEQVPINQVSKLIWNFLAIKRQRKWRFHEEFTSQRRSNSAL